MKDCNMIRKAMTLILALAVCIIPICAPAENAAEPQKITFSSTGVEMELPAAFTEASGIVIPTYDFEFPDTGVYIAGLTYYAFTEEKYNELAAKDELTDEEIEFINDRIADILWVFCIDGGRTADDIREVMENYVDQVNELREIGAVGEYRFFISAGPDEYHALRFEAKYRKEYNTLVKACENTDWIRVFEPEEPQATAAAGSSVAFETSDLAGNPVNSAELFSRYDLTMVNLWGTFCGPCIQEMPGLEQLSRKMKERNIAIVGIVLDINGPEDRGQITEAEDIIAQTGVTYLNLLPWNGINEALPSMYIPTTYFIDPQGNIVGEAAVGSRNADAYEILIDAALERIGK